MSTPFPAGTFNWVDLVAKDMTKIRSFYESLFDWTYEEQDTKGGPAYGMFKKDDKSAAGIGQMSPVMMEQGVPSTWNTYVSVDDIGATEKAIEANGGSLMMETIDIVDAGRSNWVRDPEGAVFALWQPLAHAGCEIFNTPGSFCWNERATRELDLVKRFYGNVFGWTFADDPKAPSPVSMIRNEGREIGHAILMNEQWGPIPAHWNIYFAVEDCDATMAKAKELGGSAYMDPIDIPAGRFTLLSDPDGANFYVIALTEPGK